MSQSYEPVRWGILSTGRIAGIYAKAVSETPLHGRLVAVGSRSGEKAARFAAEHGGLRAHASYEALLADPEVEAIYIGAPHTEHREWNLKAIAAGKHVLCEKPAAMTAAHAREIIEAAKARGVLWMEAFMYRCHPQTRRVVELIRSGAIGKVGLVQTSFGFRRDPDPSARLWDPKLGGGAIMDIGCYVVSLARLVAGANQGRDFENPVQVLGSGLIHPQAGVDDRAVATLRFADGLLAEVACSISLFQDNHARIYGTEGWLELESPYVIERFGFHPKMRLCRWGQAPVDHTVPIERDIYTYEVEAFAAALRSGQKEVPAMRHGDTLGNLEVLESWLAQVLRGAP